eukprot:gene3336-6600_t
MKLKTILRQAIHDLNIRGLRLAAKWASEQLLGISDSSDDDDIAFQSSYTEKISNAENDLILFANTLLGSGEYQRCASLMRTHNKKINSMLGKFIGFYALFMAGEKLKDQNITESPEGIDKTRSRNPFLLDLIRDMSLLYRENRMDGFLLYLYGVVVRDIRLQGSTTASDMAQTPSARTILIQSLQTFPLISSSTAHYNDHHHHMQDIFKKPDDVGVQDSDNNNNNNSSSNGRSSNSNSDSNKAVFNQAMSLGGWTMNLSYRVHMSLESQKGSEAIELLNQLLKLFPKSLIVATQLARAYYCSREYDKAQSYFEHIRAADPYRLEHIDTYSNILYVREKRADLSHLAHVTTKIDKFSPEVCCVVGNYYSLKGQHEKAVLHFQRALKLNPWTLMGHEYVELRNTAAAVQSYRQAVDVSPSDYRAWYGLGQTYEMLHLYQAAALRPEDARMWSAVGSCHGRLGGQVAAIRAYERAVDCEDSEGIATRELARLYRETGQLSRAASCYLRHVMSLGETAEVDSDSAEALLFLSNHHKDRGELSQAETFCSRLLCFAGPEGGEARALLRELRAVATATTATTTGSGADRRGGR